MAAENGHKRAFAAFLASAPAIVAQNAIQAQSAALLPAVFQQPESLFMNGDGEKLSPQVIMGITNAFNEGLRNLITSVHGIMPDDAVVLNTITALCVARKTCGFTEEETRDEVVDALNR